MSQSRMDKFLEALLNGDVCDVKPQSRLETFFQSLITGEACSVKPKSRLEAYVKTAIDKGVAGGGSGGSGGNVNWSESGSGGSSTPPTGSGIIRYVTFKSYDGTVEYGRKACIVGEDCVDPVAAGMMATPTRASTAQYTYTFSGGWATTPNGGKDSNALKNVTEDRVVYANFVAVTRYYTVTYYDSDGATVLKTESLAYGAMPSYKPTKEGATFTMWNPNTAVTGDMSYTAVWGEKITFANASWAKIGEIAASGQAAEYFSVGDEKTFSLTGGKTFVCTIAGFNHDTLSNNSGKAPITIVAKNVWDIEIAGLTNITKSTTNAYHVSNLNNILAGQIYSFMPTELKSVLKQVSKKCYNTSSYDYINNNYYVFALDQKELGHATGSLGETYEYFKTDSTNRRKMPKYGESTYQSYWIRDQANFNDYMSYVDSKGDIITKSLSTSTKHRVHFGFCI